MVLALIFDLLRGKALRAVFVGRARPTAGDVTELTIGYS
tara:strand:+ start:1053 stop:1169 length:117 start_codon:yes stop_codon:yes gene_type:complete